jgi:heat shock protein HslJ
MRRLFLLFLPVFVTPCIMAFIIPPIALDILEAGLKADRIIRVNQGTAGDQDVSKQNALNRNVSKQDTATLAGNWILQPVLASDTSTDRIPYIHFDLTNNRFSGFTGCNQMSGSLTVRGDRISFGSDIVLTKTACQGYNEKAFVDNLLRVSHYKISQGVLELKIDNLPVSKWARKALSLPIEKSI